MNDWWFALDSALDKKQINDIKDMYENKLIENCMNIFNGFKYTCMRRDLKLYKPLKFKNNCKT